MPSLKYPSLAQPGNLGAISLKNRVLMASLTRNRSVPEDVPNDDNVLYYSQRAKGGAGLIFSEGTLISRQGTEWPHVAGIYDEEHAKAWKKVVDSVHAEGTSMVAQLWHVGRVAHPDMELQKKAGVPVYAPSAISARGGKFRQLPGEPGYVTPTACPDVKILLDQYSNAAKMAKVAGFDGVELHSANGYLVEQFLSDNSNHRDDEYGGSIENRCRFGLEAVKRLIDVYGADRVGIKLSPCGGYNDISYSSPQVCLDTFKYYISELDKLGLAWMQITEYNEYGDPKHDGKPQGYKHDPKKEYAHLIKTSKFVINCGYSADTAEPIIASGPPFYAVTFGQNWIGNPDYYKRAQQDAPLNGNDFHTFYATPEGQNRKGYTDYPFLEEGTRNEGDMKKATET